MKSLFYFFYFYNWFYCTWFIHALLFWTFITGSSCKTADISLVTYIRLLQYFSSLKLHPFLQSTVAHIHIYLHPINNRWFKPQLMGVLHWLVPARLGSVQNIFYFPFLHHNTEVSICHGFILILNNFKYTELNYSKVEESCLWRRFGDPWASTSTILVKRGYGWIPR